MRRNAKWSKMGKKSQKVQENTRLLAAISYSRSVTPFLVFEIKTRNPNTGTENLIEIKSDPGDDNNRYHVYLNGERWQKPWSRTAFCKWLFTKIDSTRVDWS